MKKQQRNIIIAFAAVFALILTIGISVYFVKAKNNKNNIKESESYTDITTEETQSEAQTENITDKPETTLKVTTEPQTKSVEQTVLEAFAGAYCHASGCGAWYENFELKADGTFKGKYHNWDAAYEGRDGYGEASVNYEREYTGRFANIKKVDKYTFKADVVDFRGKGELDRYELGKDGQGNFMYNVIDKAPFEGSTGVTFYLKGMPRKYADDGLESLVNSKFLGEEQNWTELPFNVILAHGGYSQFTEVKNITE